jgi:hypothetical protein
VTKVQTESGTQSEQEKDKAKDVTVSVNGTAVTVPQKLTGEELKEAAIAAGVPIQLDFNLYKKEGSNYEPITDEERITVHKGEEFRCVAADDVA